MAIFATSLMIFLAVEVSYDTSVEYLVASQQVNRLRAYYAARAGMEIGLLRVLIYKKAVAQFGSQLGSNKNMLDPIWEVPFAWPPLLPEDLSSVDKDRIQSTIEESSFDGQYVSTIEVEGGKLDINDLGSEIKSLRESTRKQILTIFESEMENNEKFEDKYYGYDFEELLNNITDWIDTDEESLNGGGPENSEYSDIEDKEFIPPNAPLKTVEELNMIAGMNADFYKILAPKVTVFGVKGINVNYAPKNVLMSLAPTMTEEAVNNVITRRSTPEEGGPFTGEEDFFGFLQAERVDVTPLQESKIPLYFDAVYNFRIRSSGQFANVNREIEAIVYDFENLKERYIEIVNKEEDTQIDEGENDDGDKEKEDEEKSPANPTADGGNPNEKPKIKVPKGRPTIVYWKEN
jgi:general secretion pathway protein K